VSNLNPIKNAVIYSDRLRLVFISPLKYRIKEDLKAEKKTIETNQKKKRLLNSEINKIDLFVCI